MVKRRDPDRGFMIWMWILLVLAFVGVGLLVMGYIYFEVARRTSQF
jgi:hypothetical protein